ncbi:MAG: NAD-dependent epimerase/dehydratase family protein [Methyloligellaceae bacterium]
MQQTSSSFTINFLEREAMKRVLITGGAGQLGTILRRRLNDAYDLRISDQVKVRDLLPDQEFVKANLTDLSAVRPAVSGMDCVVHMGAYSLEEEWDTLLQANIIGTYNILEAARLEGVKRIVFASSNHVVGFYDRVCKLDHRSLPRPDSRYGVSKVFGEQMASLYADKYGLEVACIRIGHVTDVPQEPISLSIWQSPRDLEQLIHICLTNPEIKYEIVYGISDNERAWWDNSNAFRLGYKPLDKSEDYAADILSPEKKWKVYPLAKQKQGGQFVLAERGWGPSFPKTKRSQKIKSLIKKALKQTLNTVWPKK